MKYRIFKPTYTERHSGEACAAENYQIAFRDHLNRRQTFTGTPREDDTNRIAIQIEKLVRCRKSGESPDTHLKKWIQLIDEKSRDRLIKLELIDPVTLSSEIVLLEHLEGVKDGEGNIVRPGYLQEMKARNLNADHITATAGRIRRALEGAGFAHWRELIEPGAASKLQVWIGDKREKGEINGTTFNYYLRDLRTFCRWLKNDNRVPSVALENLRDVDNADSDSKKRRALSVAEMRLLVEAAAAADPRQRLTGAERAMLYRFAFETGIRPKQIRALTVADFDLDGEPPTVSSKAKNVKRRKDHVQVLRPALASALNDAFKSKMPTAAAIKMPKGRHTAIMLRHDLALARAEWIARADNDPHERAERLKSDFLCDVNQAGERAVFYSMRHGHGTALGAAGVPEKDIAASMHHASRTTTARYLHSDRRAVAGAIAAMPDLSYPMPALKTGTNDDCLRNACAGKPSKVEFGGVKGILSGASKDAESPDKTDESALFDEEWKIGLLAELADALDSKSSSSNGVSVRLR